MMTTIIELLLGGWDAALDIMLIIMALDYITGVGAAFKTKSVSSSIGYTGLLKKASIFIIVILAAQMDKMIGSSNNLFRNGTALSFSINDALSILENVGRLGIKLPSFLRAAFVRLQQNNDALISERSKAARPADNTATQEDAEDGCTKEKADHS